MAETLTKAPPRYSCGHLRTEKGKHACPACLAARRVAALEKYRVKARARHHIKPGQTKEAAPLGRPQAIVSAERKAAAIARIKAAIDGTHDWKVIAARLGGVSRQRVFQLLRWLELQTDCPAARLLREAERLKREFYRAEKESAFQERLSAGRQIRPRDTSACWRKAMTGSITTVTAGSLKPGPAKPDQKKDQPAAVHRATAGWSKALGKAALCR